MFSTQQYFGFDPRTIHGCQLWLDAADTNTFTFSSGSNISTWRDKSGNNFTGTAVNLPTQTSNSINGLPAVVFSTGTQFINYGNILNLGTNAVYMFSVVKYDSTLDGAIVSKSRAAGGAGRWALMRQAVAGGTLALADAAGSGIVAAYADTSTTPQLVSGYWDRSNVFIRQNGTQRNVVGLLNTTTSYSTTDLLFVGAYQSTTGGIPPSSGFYLNGKIGEIIVYITPTLSLVQIQQIEGYLAWKWGLNTSLPVGHPFKPNPTTMRIFQPTDIAGLEFWMDPSDKSTITPAGITNGQTITAIRDKSGNNRPITIEAGTPTYATSGAITFNGSTRLGSSVISALGTGAYYIAIMVKLTGSSTVAQTPITIGDPGGSAQVGVMFVFDSVTGYTFTDWAQTAYITPNVPYNANLILTGRRSGGVVNQSVLTQSYTPGARAGGSSGANTLTSRVCIGYLNLNPSTPQNIVQGEIGEVIIYRGSITDSDEQRIELYLARKWGLSFVNLRNTSTYSLSKALPSTPLFSPLHVGNLALWLDAADSSTITGTTTVTQWNDKSGNGRNATASSAFPILTQNAINGRQSILFGSGGTQSFMSISSLFNISNNAINLFAVVLPTGNPISPTNTPPYGGIIAWSGFDAGLLYRATNPNTIRTEWWNSANNAVVNRDNTLAVGTAACVTANFYVSNSIAYVENTVNTSALIGSNATFSTFKSNFTALSIGRANSGLVTGFQGYISEIIVYNGVSLTTAQRQQVQGYLAWKWGLQNSLPTTHPYYKFRA